MASITMQMTQNLPGIYPGNQINDQDWLEVYKYRKPTKFSNYVAHGGRWWLWSQSCGIQLLHITAFTALISGTHSDFLQWWLIRAKLKSTVDKPKPLLMSGSRLVVTSSDVTLAKSSSFAFIVLPVACMFPSAADGVVTAREPLFPLNVPEGF